MSSDSGELAEALVGQSAHAAPAHILEGLPGDLAQRKIAGAPHTIYQELWHIVFWQQMTLDWISGVETLFPANAADPFPTEAQAAAEPWPDVCRRFLAGADQAAQAAADVARRNVSIRCPSRPGQPVRIMTVQDQLISLAAHNAYHFGRIVLFAPVARVLAAAFRGIHLVVADAAFTRAGLWLIFDSFNTAKHPAPQEWLRPKGQR